MKRSKTISAECRLRIADCRRAVAGRRARAGIGAVVAAHHRHFFSRESPAHVAQSRSGTTLPDGGHLVHFSRIPATLRASCGPEAQRALEAR